MGATSGSTASTTTPPRRTAPGSWVDRVWPRCAARAIRCARVPTAQAYSKESAMAAEYVRSSPGPLGSVTPVGGTVPDRVRPDRAGPGRGRGGGRRPVRARRDERSRRRAAPSRRGVPRTGAACRPRPWCGPRRCWRRRGGLTNFAGTSSADPEWAVVARRVKQVSDGWDDTRAAERLAKTGATLLRGRGVITGPGKCE